MSEDSNRGMAGNRIGGQQQRILPAAMQHETKV